MQLDLTEEQELLQSTFADLFAAESSPEQVRAAEATGFDAGLWKHLVETGAIGIRVPEERGGIGSGLHDAALLVEQAGRALVSGPLVESICAAGALARVANEEADALLAELLEGQLVATLALQEVERNVEQLIMGGAVADVVIALDRDEWVALRRPANADRTPLPNLGSSGLARWRLDAACNNACTAPVMPVSTGSGWLGGAATAASASA